MKIIQFIVFIAFGVAGAINQIVFFAEIEPALRRLGYKFDVISLRKYPKGMSTLWEYKRFVVSQNRSLKLWWLYWSSFWCGLVIWLLSMIAVFCAG